MIEGDARVIEEEVRPLLRGLSHAYAFWVALIAAALLTAVADGRTERGAAAVYGAGLCVLFATSSTYHRWRWDPRWRPLLRRIDHSTIFVFIAATYTPVSLLALHGTLRSVVLTTVWGGALVGVAMSVAWIDAPRVLSTACYTVVGSAAFLAVPQLLDALGTTGFALLMLGGAFYLCGAVVYALKRPDPWPAVFGFHEVFHALVILAAASQFAAIAGWLY